MKIQQIAEQLINELIPLVDTDSPNWGKANLLYALKNVHITGLKMSHLRLQVSHALQMKEDVEPQYYLELLAWNVPDNDYCAENVILLGTMSAIIDRLKQADFSDVLYQKIKKLERDLELN